MGRISISHGEGSFLVAWESPRGRVSRGNTQGAGNKPQRPLVASHSLVAEDKGCLPSNVARGWGCLS